MLNKKIKIEISTKIQNLNNKLKQLDTEIVGLDRQLTLKRQDFLRIEGAIKGLEMALTELNVEEKEDVQGESEDEE